MLKLNQTHFSFFYFIFFTLSLSLSRWKTFSFSEVHIKHKGNVYKKHNRQTVSTYAGIDTLGCHAAVGSCNWNKIQNMKLYDWIVFYWCKNFHPKNGTIADREEKKYTLKRNNNWLMCLYVFLDANESQLP